jgi:cytochrome P450
MATFLETLPLPVRDAKPPGPRNLPFVGNALLARSNPLGTLERWAHEYGDVIHYRFFDAPVYILAHPQDIEQVLLGKSRNFIKGMTSRANPELFGNGLLTSDGEFWRRQRRLANPAFHRENMNRYAEITIEEGQRVLARWQAGEVRDVHRDMMNATLRIVLRSLFGVELGERGRIIGRALDVIMQMASGFNAVLSYLRIPTPLRRGYFRAVSDLDVVVYELIALGRERMNRGSDEMAGAHDLLTMLLMARDDDGNAMTDQQLRDEVITLLLAGHETTALNLSWTWYLLALHPEIEQRLHAELDRVLGEQPPRPDQLTKLPYTDRVLREALRLYPPAWRIWRTPLEPFEAREFVLPAGVNVVLSQWLTHRDARWFPEPERFHPDRWSEECAANLPRFAFFPFGGGPRVCIGAGFATMEATLLLATIAQRYRLRLAPGHRVEPLASITLRPKHGVHVELEARNAARLPAQTIATNA